MRIDWQNVVLPRAAAIVESYDTGVTLRQLFYRLVSEELIQNTQSKYKYLSSVTAKGRRDGTFPELFDRTREIHLDASFSGPDDARRWLKDVYRRDRTEGQEYQVYVGVEKHGLVEMLRQWFGNYGIPIVALGGYSSQTYVNEVGRAVSEDGRPAVMLYGGDFDPSGEDIPRDFLKRVTGIEELRRVALTSDQVTAYDLPPQKGKATDSRASQFAAKHGRLVQVEIDALEPTLLRGLYTEALAEYWDTSTYEAAMERERQERSQL